ncbi:MAG TPA: patatin-like phospholipase family protein [Acidimicrobiales bacterium]|jgi:NTE family protein|nr:patatin-like phospholipase family protein [Acidimicrobiales bacterium]
MATRIPSRRHAPSTPDVALPRSFEAGYGQNVDLGLCLGGGGLFFVAWQVSYLQTLATRGIHFDSADRVVGTSAGSMVASALTAGRLNRLHTEISLLARVPALVSALAPASELSPSQQRALDLFLKAADGEPTTVQEIGYAALAASTPSPAAMRRNISLVLGRTAWTSDALRITCVDAYTAERCVVTRDSRVTIPRAVAASSAVPGIFPPQPVGDRRCMDGGVIGTGTHLDLLAGANRVLILALTDGSDMNEGMMTIGPGGGAQELVDLEASGTTVLLRTPAEVDMLELMEPAAVPRALAMGARQASADLGELSAFWDRVSTA